ncbi:DNA-directed RNA polymerase subunit beta' [bacterium SM23_31]|nr:MAG: DNA-directed RNA polymerase subunit beta' [bacterium SM23_31]
MTLQAKTSIEIGENRSFSKISINLASPDTILAQSYGEVLKPETINYRSFKPEKDGLFCEKIFGPVRDWECHCGKYKRIRYKGIICDRCGVEITMKSVRRERMGHIQLATPVVHIWYFRSLPSKIGYILGMSVKDLEHVIYYESYVVITPGKTGLKAKELIPEEEYFRIINEFPEEKSRLDEEGKDKFSAKIGGEAIKSLLKHIDLSELSATLRAKLKTETSIQRKNDILKRLKVIESLKVEGTENYNRPEWMVLDVVPVIPPELRPLVPLEGGRFATSDLNDLYRRVIIRNNRLKNLIEIRAPEVILRNEKRMLQESVDSLFDNGRKATAVRSDGNRPLKSLSDILKGKQGRFRQNLLGKRVDYSGRSVIVVGPELKLHECGLPKDMAVELFKPFIIRKLVGRGSVKTVKSAKKLVDKKGKEIWDILETIIKDHLVLLNRAPTLHRLGIQAFQPVLIEGKAIRIHPLVCAAFNADFDGDQMAVHVPLSYEAQLETRMLMLSSHNILSPANGRPIATPSQDIVLGCYYLTKIRHGDKGEGKLFSNQNEVLIAFDAGKIGLHAQISVRIDGSIIKTTTGRIMFNQIVPKGLMFVNEILTKSRMEELIAQAYRLLGNKETAEFLDRLKDLGFYYAMKAGVSIGIDDVIIPNEKKKLIEIATEEVEKIQHQYERGVITDGERYNKIIDIWMHTITDVSRTMFDGLSTSCNGFNPVFMMADSGARGSKEQIRQLAGMRGLMAKPQKSMTGQTGEIIESPITANFKEGLSVLEYFISTHGARKGLADTALKTADAGYLTRRLVDVSQDVIITEEDCGTIRGLEISALKEGEDIIEPLHERILGRIAADDIYNPQTEEIIVEANDEVDEEAVKKIADSIIESVNIRSVLTCESQYGVCQKCYGRNLATGKIVNISEAVGVIAAQSIGEPGTQLTLRTFHIGGTAQVGEAQSEVKAKYAGRIVYSDNIRVTSQEIFPDQKVNIALGRNGRIEILDENNRVIAKYTDPYSMVILSEFGGTVKFVDIKEGVTVKEELDEQTGLRQRVIVESRNRKLNPNILLLDEEDKKLASYIIPTKAMLMVNDGDHIKPGDILVKLPRGILKSKDITGGLPRVAELFEARKPKEPAVVSEIDGIIKFGNIKRGIREIIVQGKSTKKTYMIPYGKHVLVHSGDEVEAGERLSEGSIAPHDILRIKDANAVQEYLVNEIQEVYRLQGVRINDKHIEIIVRQMLQQIQVVDPGDTGYLEGDLVDKAKFLVQNEKISQYGIIENPGDSRLKENELVELFELDRLNERLEKQEKKVLKYRNARPATFVSKLLGITQAALSTESFISSASFQETTRVLTEAAIQGKVDYLRGLKENVIIGHLVPAGTGLKELNRIRIKSDADEEEKLAEVEIVHKDIEEVVQEKQSVEEEL